MSEKSRLLPTPKASDGEKTSPNQKNSDGSPGLMAAVKLWPTPTKGDGEGGGTETHDDRLHCSVKRQDRGSSPAVFPASHSVVPGSDEATRMTVSSGLKCSALCRNSGPVGCSVRTYLASSRWHSTIVLLRWKVSATPRGRLLFRLAPSTPRTDATGCGLWPTPRSGKTTDELEETWQKRKDAGGVATPPLSLAVKMWPTVKGSPSGPDFARANREGSGGDDLATTVAKMLPTPNTPRPHDNEDTAGRDYPSQNQKDLARVVAGPVNGQLNPRFVEWLMGYPQDWTELDNG
jgi:hypothetical protein